MRSGLGDVSAIFNAIGPGMVYAKLTTPIGVAIVDPFAQDPSTQELMRRLGIRVTVGLGPVPALEAGETSLVDNLALGIPLVLGAVAFALRPKPSTLLVAGGAALVLHSGLLASLFRGTA